jgi:hypothetical protein
MKTCLITDNSEIDKHTKNYQFDKIITIDQLHPERFFIDLIDRPDLTDALKHSDLAFIDIKTNAYYVILSALKNGVNVLSPNLLELNHKQIMELDAVSHEISVEFGIPYFTFPNIDTNKIPAFIESQRKYSDELTLETFKHYIDNDLVIPLTFIKSEIRKVKAYLLPPTGNKFKSIKLVTDFFDDSLLIHTMQASNKSSYTIQLETKEKEETIKFEKTEIYSNASDAKEHIEFFLSRRKMIYSSETLKRVKQVSETISKKFELLQ